MRTTIAMIALLGAACGSDPTEPETPGELAVTVKSPAAGTVLAGSEHPAITVTGTVTTTNPDYGELEAWVNGTRWPVAADGSFSAELAPELGINHVVVEGGDGIGALVPGGELDVMWAPGYLAPVAGTTSFDLAGGLDLSLGQRFFDRRLTGTTLDRTTDPVVAHDLAAALELILWHIDLATLVPGGIQIGEGDAAIDLQIPSVTPKAIVADIEISNDPQRALQLDLALENVVVATTGTFKFRNETLQIQGGIAADLFASARLTFSRGEDGSIRVGTSAVTASVGPLEPRFTGPDAAKLSGFIAITDSQFHTLIEKLVEDELIPMFTNRVPPLLETLLGATDSVLDDVSFTIDAGLGTPVTLQLDGRVGALDVVPGATTGHLTLHHDLSVWTAGDPIHPDSPGAPRSDLAPAASPASATGVRLGVQLDLINGLLHALWNGGLLEGETTFGTLVAKVSAKLPPAVRPTPLAKPCTIAGERCDITLQIGQLEVGLPDFSQRFVVNAEAGARIIIDGTSVSIAIEPTPTIRVWDISGAPGTLTPDVVRDLIAQLVWPPLASALAERLKLTLPLPNLADLGLADLAPGLANAALQLEIRRPTMSSGFLSLDGDLELATPPPPAPPLL